jgi:hypothetical protein
MTMARFVTARVISVKLGVMIPLGNMPSLFGSPREPMLSSGISCPSAPVTAGGIDLKFCTGEMTVQTKFRSDLILGLATRGPKLKTHKVL